MPKTASNGKGTKPEKSQAQKAPEGFESVSDFLARMKTFPPVFFDARDGSYWFQVNGRFLPLSTRSLGNHFAMLGVNKMPVLGLNIRQCDWPIYNAEVNNVVDYAGPLAGYRAGLHKQKGKSYLVTEEPQGVWDDFPKDGTPKFFLEFVQELLPEDQWVHFCYWLALGLQSLRNGDFRPGQCVILAGPAQCGKSLLQYIITQVYGGRSASPFDYMFGSTSFNFDLIQAEHWMWEDPPTSTDIRTRREFGERMKECVNNDQFKAHKKNKDGEMVRIFRRNSGSINNEPEHLAQVPPMEEGTRDKIFLFKCSVARDCLRRFVVSQEQAVFAGVSGETPVKAGQQDRKKLLATIAAELPVLRGWLLRMFTNVPEELIDTRMGIRAWHHPELLAEIHALAPEERLLQLIDSVLWDEEFPTLWEGKSMELETALRARCSSEVERIFRFVNACGAYLGKLLRRHPHRISSRKKDGYTLWKILPPSKTEETEKEQQQ